MKIANISRFISSTFSMLQQLTKPRDKLVEYCKVNFEKPVLTEEYISPIGVHTGSEELPNYQIVSKSKNANRNSDVLIDIPGFKPLTLSNKDVIYLQKKLNNVKHIVCYCDGSGLASKVLNNASCAAVLYEKNRAELVKLGANLGLATNNVSEYFSIIIPMAVLEMLKLRDIEFYMDSLLVCNQILGSYKVKASHMVELNAFVYK